MVGDMVRQDMMIIWIQNCANQWIPNIQIDGGLGVPVKQFQKKKLNNVQRQVTGLWLGCERWHSDEDETDSPSD